MCRNHLSRLMLLAVVAVVSVSATPAEEIVHFTNGTEMAIVSHVVEDGMVHIDLGGNALIAFPMTQVERISKAGIDVMLPSSFTPANVSASGERAGRVRTRSAGFQTGGVAYGSASSRSSAMSNRAAADTPSIQNLLGMAAAANSRPAGNGSVRVVPSNHPNRGARQLRANGRVSAFQGAAIQDGSVDSLGRTINGEAKLMLPKLAARSSQGVDVLRLLPSDAAAAAGVAAGQPLQMPPPPPPAETPPSSGSDQ